MQGQVKVTPARWWHVPAVANLIRETRRRRFAPGGAALVWAPRWSPSLALLQSVWSAPVQMPGMRMARSFVAEQGGRAIGLGQMRPRREPNQWEVTYLAIEPDGAAAVGDDGRPRLRLLPDRRATRLAGELCDAAVMVGAERLFVHVPDNSGGYEVFRQVGFTAVVREFTYFRPIDGSTSAAAAPSIAGLRRQHRADGFGVLQLYLECTPKMVQLAEGKRSQSWELGPSGLQRRITNHERVQRWVVERDGRIVAWLHLAGHRRAQHQMQLLVADRASDVAGDLVRFGVANATQRGAPGVAAHAREYQPHLMSELEAQGFEPLESHLLMVKQLAARVTQPGFAPALEKAV